MSAVRRQHGQAVALPPPAEPVDRIQPHRARGDAGTVAEHPDDSGRTVVAVTVRVGEEALLSYENLVPNVVMPGQLFPGRRDPAARCGPSGEPRWNEEPRSVTRAGHCAARLSAS